MIRRCFDRMVQKQERKGRVQSDHHMPGAATPLCSLGGLDDSPRQQASKQVTATDDDDSDGSVGGRIRGFVNVQ